MQNKGDTSSTFNVRFLIALINQVMHWRFSKKDCKTKMIHSLQCLVSIREVNIQIYNLDLNRQCTLRRYSMRALKLHQLRLPMSIRGVITKIT